MELHEIEEIIDFFEDDFCQDRDSLSNEVISRLDLSDKEKECLIRIRESIERIYIMNIRDINTSSCRSINASS